MPDAHYPTTVVLIGGNIILYTVNFDSLHRLLLAVLHFNENSNRRQATTRSGAERYSVTQYKYKPDRPIVKAIKVPMTFG